MKRETLLIFDWDCTLCDSASKIIHCLQLAAETAGVRVCSDDDARNIIGLGLPQVMERLYPELSISERDRVRRYYVEQFLAADQVASPFFEGVMDGLHQLRDSGFLLAVATGKSRRGLDRVWSNINMQGFFHGSRCADEAESKPSPKMLEQLLDEFSLSANQALMIGDTEYDMSMAEQIQMPRVAVSYGAHSVDRVQKYQPLLIADHFSDMVGWILNYYS